MERIGNGRCRAPECFNKIKCEFIEYNNRLEFIAIDDTTVYISSELVREAVPKFCEASFIAGKPIRVDRKFLGDIEILRQGDHLYIVKHYADYSVANTCDYGQCFDSKVPVYYNSNPLEPTDKNSLNYLPDSKFDKVREEKINYYEHTLTIETYEDKKNRLFTTIREEPDHYLYWDKRLLPLIKTDKPAISVMEAHNTKRLIL